MKKKQIKFIITLMVFLGTVSPSFSIEKPKQVTLNSTKENIPEEVSIWLEKELANSSTQVLENFEVPEFFTSKNAKIIGYIKGYDQNQGAKTGIFYYSNDLTNESKPRVLEIYKDGRFELELPLEYPMLDSFIIDGKLVQFYLEPGQNLSVILEGDELNTNSTKQITYFGKLSKINTELLNYQPRFSHRKILQMRKEMDAISFQKEVFKFKKHFEDKIGAHLDSGVIEAKTAELLENKIVLRAYEYMFDYFSFSKKRELERKGINMLEMIPKGYYDFINEIPLDKQSILVNDEFASFVNSLEFSPPLSYRTKGYSYSSDYRYSSFLKHLKSMRNNLSSEVRKLLDDVVKGGVSDELTAEQRVKLRFLEKNHRELYDDFSDYVNKQTEKERARLYKIGTETLWRKKDSLASALGIKNKLIYDIIKTRTLNSALECSEDNSSGVNEWMWNYIKKDLTSPLLQKVGDRFLEKVSNETKQYELPVNEKGTEIFKKLISPYKGKVVIVQYWSPRSYYKGEGLEYMKKRRNLFRGNSEVVFLDVTDEKGSSLEEYNKSVEENGFENSIRIPQDDYHYLLQLFKFNGEIKNIVVNPEGEIVRGYRPGVHLTNFLRENFNILPVQK